MEEKDEFDGVGFEEIPSERKNGSECWHVKLTNGDEHYVYGKSADVMTDGGIISFGQKRRDVTAIYPAPNLLSMVKVDPETKEPILVEIKK